MKTGSIVSFVLAGLLAISATVSVFSEAGGAGRPDGTENLVGYAVGAYLPAVVLLIVGLSLMKKAK